MWVIPWRQLPTLSRPLSSVCQSMKRGRGFSQNSSLFWSWGAVVCRMFDVGGQRSERKKWIHCFEGRHSHHLLCSSERL